MSRSVFPILYCRDLGSAILFYRDSLGMTERYRYPAEGEAEFVTLTWGESEVGLGTYDPIPGLEGRCLLYPGDGRGFELCIYVDDVDALVARLAAQGVRIVVPPVDQPWGERLAYIQDPEGNTIMLTAITADTDGDRA